MNPKARIAVAGAGLIGKRHIEMAAKAERAQLSAIVDPSPAAQLIAQQYGVPLYASLDELLKADRPDGVVLATPNQMHLAHALECIAKANYWPPLRLPGLYSAASPLRCCQATLARSQRATFAKVYS